ncbi:MAG: SDR family NAD(P)-dependent oxidoreductase [Actinobacteria bacterium]|nr:SDR family NAD(P)-dependent oxidoreductase [Actinomycetota bacterium]
MGTLDGRVALITGAGRGIGREHALLFAQEGAKVVVNDLGTGHNDAGEDVQAAQTVVDEIVAAGGEALANTDDIATFAGAGRLVSEAVDAFGHLDVVVNNAGILRDAFLTKMTEEEFDLVIAVHLKGHFSVLRHAAEHWRERAKSGEAVQASVINTASASGTHMVLPGQANYAAAKAGIAAMTLVAAAELSRIGVRVNAIAPAARTRLTVDVPGVVGEMMAQPDDPDAFDAFDPANIPPLVAYLAAVDTEITGRVFHVQGGEIAALDGWRPGAELKCDGPWTIEEIAERLPATLG